jgi:hypothetical protein
MTYNMQFQRFARIVYEMFAADSNKFWFLHGVVKHGLCIPLPPPPPKKKSGPVLRVMELLLPFCCWLKLHDSLKSCMPVQILFLYLHSSFVGDVCYLVNYFLFQYIPLYPLFLFCQYNSQYLCTEYHFFWYEFLSFPVVHASEIGDLKSMFCILDFTSFYTSSQKYFEQLYQFVIFLNI